MVLEKWYSFDGSEYRLNVSEGRTSVRSGALRSLGYFTLTFTGAKSGGTIVNSQCTGTRVKNWKDVELKIDTLKLVEWIRRHEDKEVDIRLSSWQSGPKHS